MARIRAKKSSRASTIVATIEFGPAFYGELTCANCLTEANSAKLPPRNWRCFDVNNQRFYCCPKCHPDAGSAQTEECQAWMIPFFQEHVMPQVLKKKITSVLYWRQTAGMPICEKIQ